MTDLAVQCRAGGRAEVVLRQPGALLEGGSRPPLNYNEEIVSTISAYICHADK